MIKEPRTARARVKSKSTAAVGIAADPINLKRAEKSAVEAARSVGLLMKRHLAETRRADQEDQYDIKLELDVRAQTLIERTLRSAFPNVAVLGEDGVLGEQNAEHRWVVDPIDGTVNFAYD